MRKAVWILCSLIVTSGCTQLKQVQNLDQLLVLKEYADEKEAQEKWVSQEAEDFEALLAAVDGKLIDDQSAAVDVLSKFGEPVLREKFANEGRAGERWLYRHPIQKLATDRVYLYFDENDRLVRYEHVAQPSVTERTS